MIVKFIEQLRNFMFNGRKFDLIESDGELLR